MYTAGTGIGRTKVLVEDASQQPGLMASFLNQVTRQMKLL